MITDIVIVVNNLRLTNYSSYSRKTSMFTPIGGFNITLVNTWNDKPLPFNVGSEIVVMYNTKDANGNKNEVTGATGYITSINYEFSSNSSTILLECKDKSIDIQECNFIFPTEAEIASESINSTWRSEYSNITLKRMMENILNPLGISVFNMPDKEESEKLSYTIDPQKKVIDVVKDLCKKYNMFFFTTRFGDLKFVKRRGDFETTNIPVLELGKNILGASVRKDVSKIFSDYEVAGQPKISSSQNTDESIKKAITYNKIIKFEDGIQKTIDLGDLFYADRLIDIAPSRYRPTKIKTSDDASEENINKLVNMSLISSIAQSSRLSVELNDITYVSGNIGGFFEPAKLVSVILPLQGFKNRLMVVDSIDITIDNSTKVMMTLVSPDVFQYNSLFDPDLNKVVRDFSDVTGIVVDKFNELKSLLNR